MYDRAINYLKNLEMIDKEDIIVACTDCATTPTASAGACADEVHYILAANDEGLRIFDVDRRTGTFLGTYSRIVKDEITAAGINGSMGSFTLTLRTVSERLAYETNVKLYGREQKGEILRLKEYFRSGFKAMRG